MVNKRIIIDRPGGSDRLRLLEEALPVPNANEVRIRVRACGVAFGDILLRQGGTPGAPPFPVTPGYDLVGLIDEVGGEVKHLKTGDYVAAFPGIGGYTTYICVPASEVVRVPAHLPAAEVVSVILNYTTAFQLLTTAKLTDGNTVLMHGAAGGVGTALLQLAKLMRINVYGSVSTAKMGVVEQAGGIPIDYTKTDFVAEIRRLTGAGVDAVFDPIGGAHLSRSYSALNATGTLVMFGASSTIEGGGNPTIKLLQTIARLLFLKLRPNGKHVKTYSITTPRSKTLYADIAAMIRLLDEGKIKPIIAKTFPLSEAAEAQAMLEQQKPVGKIVLLPA